MEKKKINSTQLGVLIYYLSTTCFLGIGLTNVEKIVHQDAWISALIGIAIGFIPIILYIIIANHQPDLNIIQLNRKLFGKYLGFFINFIIIILVLIFGLVTLSNLTKFIQINFLKYTPNFVIGGLFLVIAGITAIRGIEVLTRAAITTYTLSIILFLTIAISLTVYIDLSNIKPILEYGAFPLIKGGGLVASISTAPIFTLLIIPKKSIADEKNYNRAIIVWYIIISLVIFVIFLWVISILGSKLIAIHNYPEYAVLKKIAFMNFIERIENNAAALWLFDYFFSLAFVLYFIKESIHSTIKIKKPIWSTIIVTITALLLLSVPSFLFQKYVDLETNFFDYYGTIIGLGIFSITIIIFIRLLFDKKRA